MAGREVLIHQYEQYLDACNRRAWNEIEGYVADRVLVNGKAQSRGEYIANIIATTEVFPDYRWELRRTVVEGEWIAVHLGDSGTRTQTFMSAPGDARRVTTIEFDMYRWVDGVIVEVEGTADNARLNDTSSSSGPALD